MSTENTLITEASVIPKADEACASLCYYLGWDFDHAHAKAAEAPTQQTSPDS